MNPAEDLVPSMTMSSTPSPTPAPALTPTPPLSTSLRVLLDPGLLRHVTAFQAGIPLALRPYWLQLDASVVQLLRHTTLCLYMLQGVIVAQGSPYELELMPRARFLDSSGNAIGTGLVDYDSVAVSAITHRRVDMLQWAINQGPCESANAIRAMWSNALQQYQPGDMVVLEILKTHRPIDGSNLESVLALANAIDRVDRKLVQWVHEYAPFVRLPIDHAIKRGDVAMVRYVMAHGLHKGTVSALAIATAHAQDQFDVLDCLLEYSAESIARGEDGERVQQAMVSDPRSETQALVKKYIHAFAAGFDHLIRESVDGNHLEIVQKVYDAGGLAKLAPISVDVAAERGSLDTIRFLHEKDMALVTPTTMDRAAVAKAWHVVDFLHANRTEGCTTRAMDAAVQANDLARVRFFHENRSEGCSQDAMRLAAAAGNMAILRFLDENMTVGCTTDAMDAAAEVGCLEAVQFLHEHRSEGCTTAAMDKAAARGHTEVVRFLARNRQEGCTVAAVQRALLAGHLQIVSTIYSHYPHLFGSHLLHDLLLRGAFDIYMALRETYPEQANAVVRKVMYTAGRELELPTIRFIHDTLGHGDLGFLAMDGAALCCSERWLSAVYSITGPGSCNLSTVRNTIRSDKCGTDDTAHIRFVVRACIASQPRARGAALAMAKLHNAALAELLEDDQVGSGNAMLTPHPFFLDARTPPWAIKMIANKYYQEWDPHGNGSAPLTWAVRAVYRGDTTLLDVLRDLTSNASEPPLHSKYINDDAYQGYEPFSFKGAHTAAIQANRFSVLKWLMENADMPVEPTLLGEAVYLHHFEIAEWLVVHHFPHACQTLDWKNVRRATHRGVNSILLDWLEAHAAVRNALPVAELIDHAVASNNVEALRRYVEWYPQVLMMRTTLRALARETDSPQSLAFLEEIAYPHP